MARVDYFQSAFPEPWQVLGYQLKPFSLGHYIKLRSFDNAFVADTARHATLGDLCLGVLVCSLSSHPDQTQDPFYRWLNRPRRFWSKFTPAEKDVVKWGKRCRGEVLTEKARTFSAYIDAHTQEPLYWKVRDDCGGNQGAHWSHAVVSALVSECGYSQVEALNTPMGKALHDYYRKAEAEGSVRLMTAEEIEFINGGAI